MIKGLDIFYSSKIKGQGLSLLKTKGEGLQLIKTAGQCNEICNKKNKKQYAAGLKTLT